MLLPAIYNIEMDTPSKEEYCDPANRIKIAATTPYLLPFYDDYCKQVSEVCVIPTESDPPQSIDPPQPTEPPKEEDDNFFFWLWIIASVITLIFIASALLMT
jgi:hypothetical protein